MKTIHWYLGLFIAVSFFAADLLLAADPFHKWIYALLFVCFLVLVRLYLGPTSADRVAALDILGILVIGFCGILALVAKNDLYLDIALAWALQAFIGTLAFAKYLEGKSFND